MPASLTLPSLDNNVCGSWTEEDKDTYNKLPYYFVRATGQWQKRYDTWAKLLDSIPWTPNSGITLREVGVEPTPVLRQKAYPNTIQTAPMTDISKVSERISDAVLYEHQFVSPHFNFLPAFQDFLGSKVKPNQDSLSKMIQVYTETFYRTYMYDMAPYVYICGVGLVAAPSGIGNSAGTAANTKNNAWFAANVGSKLGNDLEPLSFKSLYTALNDFEQQVGATPYQGTMLPTGTSAPLDDKFLIVGQSEVWNGFINDPWVKENRPLNLNILTQGFYGDIFGRATFRHEKYGLRAKVDPATLQPTWVAPETSELDATSPNYYRTMPNPEYAKADTSQIGVAWLVGGPNYKIIRVGPPPAEFAQNDVNGLVGLNWNGKVQMTKNFLIYCMDASGNIVPETNSFGRYLRLQSTVVMGIAGYNKFNVMPIFYKRQNTINTVTS